MQAPGIAPMPGPSVSHAGAMPPARGRTAARAESSGASPRERTVSVAPGHWLHCSPGRNEAPKARRAAHGPRGGCAAPSPWGRSGRCPALRPGGVVWVVAHEFTHHGQEGDQGRCVRARTLSLLWVHRNCAINQPAHGRVLDQVNVSVAAASDNSRKFAAKYLIIFHKNKRWATAHSVQI